jgi:hypothetical protein
MAPIGGDLSGYRTRAVGLGLKSAGRQIMAVLLIFAALLADFPLLSPHGLLTTILEDIVHVKGLPSREPVHQCSGLDCGATCRLK